MRLNKRHSGGFSLLEMVVAMVILAMSLGIMYQAVGGATRNVRADEKYAYAVELARSLLASHAQVPRSGLEVKGETQGNFSWQVQTSDVELPKALAPGALQAIAVTVNWPDGKKQSSFTLYSVVEGIGR
jgi:general secretion pathway protein I